MASDLDLNCLLGLASPNTSDTYGIDILTEENFDWCNDVCRSPRQSFCNLFKVCMYT